MNPVRCLRSLPRNVLCFREEGGQLNFMGFRSLHEVDRVNKFKFRLRDLSNCQEGFRRRDSCNLVCAFYPRYIQGSTKRRAPGCVNAAGKLRQKW